MQFRRRFALAVGLAAGIVVLATMLAAGGAAAQPITTVNYTGDNTDPQTTNVPYLAWAGEQIRLVKCYTPGELTGAPASAQFAVVSWSGDLGPNSSPRPDVETGTQSFVTDPSGRTCVRGDVVSTHPGLAAIKLVVTDAAGNIVAPKHDFLAIWMQISSVALSELPGGGDNGTGHFDFNASNGPNRLNPGLVGVTVKGQFPWNGATWTLPDQWADLANALAVDNDNPSNPGPNEGAGPTARWDIHDDNALTEGHPAVTGCTTDVIATLIEAVDNCNGGGPFGDVFSRFFGIDTTTGARLGDTAGSGTGPFDPTDPSTLLSDGKLDQFDAPMPAAPIYLTLSGDVGALNGAPKYELMSRDGTGANTPHNLYAPYYAEWIPSTDKADWASGIDGPALGNNFPGFQNSQDSPYTFWDAIPEVTRSGPANACHDALGNTVPTPFGNTEIIVYTDEHGDAVAEFDPTAGFNLAVSANNLCPAIAGAANFTATITAEAKYPFQPAAVAANGITVPAAAPASLTKTVATAGLKALSCVPKGTNSAFCVEQVNDIFGNPVAGAPVLFTANSLGNANIQADATAFGTFDTTLQGPATSTNNESAVQLTTGPNGQAGVLITDSLAADCVNLRAENLGTRFNGNPGISVFTDFNPAAGAACTAGPTGVNVGGTTGTTTTTTGGSSTTTGGSSTTTGGSTTTTGGTSTTGHAATNNNTGGSPASTTNAGTAGVNANTTAIDSKPTVVTAKAKATVTIALAKVISIGNGRYLGLHLKSTLTVAKVNITLVGAHNKVLGHVIRTVKTGKLVRVLKLGANVRSVRVAPIISA